ncbi:MAG: ubiquinol-cytochrome c reductase iron-sulfur subunit [Myxococcaceae bacterium]
MTSSHSIEAQAPPSRRNFLAAAFAWLGFGTAMAGAFSIVFRYLIPEETGPRARRVYVGLADELELKRPRLVSDLQGRPVAVFGPPSNPVALSLTCTHLGCGVHWEEDEQEFLCPCHGGRFSASGAVVSGPPPSPLTHYATVVEHGAVYVELPEV